ncbi:MAG: YraN family protein [Anaerolineaceae bacterium]|nr:YraN family protein [Anaerolineaceae bacterium]
MNHTKVKNFHNRRVGAWGENLAADYLLGQGYELVARNVRSEAGEIDLIVRKGNLLTFVEVKTRRNKQFGDPEESITPAKQQRMGDAAELWLADHPEETGDWQLDVIAIYQPRGARQPEILHLEGEFD